MQTHMFIFKLPTGVMLEPMSATQQSMPMDGFRSECILSS